MTIVDISLELTGSYRHQTPEGVKDVQLEIELIKDYPGGLGQQVRAVRMRLHHGTHVDAPMHYVQGGAPLAAIPLDVFYGDTIVLDLTPADENSPILPERLREVLGTRTIEGKRVLLRTDWNYNYGAAEYLERSPYITPAAVDWITERRPVLVGYDYAHGKDAPESPSRSYALRTFLGNGIVVLGYLRNLDKIDATRPVILAAFPLAFGDPVEASPVRAVLIQTP